MIKPNWPAAPNVHAFTTTRDIPGVSLAPFQHFNLAEHVTDNATHVAQNRDYLVKQFGLPDKPCWINQVHGNVVVMANHDNTTADACYTDRRNVVCVVQTADCLPILITNLQGTEIAAIHGGWRSLAANIIENTINCFQTPAAELLAWLGPAIGPCHFEVGSEVKTAFSQLDTGLTSAFAEKINQKYLANLYQIATSLLYNVGVSAVYGGECCTYCDADRFYSYRRDRVTGRMASIIWV